MQRVALLVLAFLASAASAQFPGQPEKTEPLQLLPLAEVQKQVAEARGYQAEGLPDAEARKKVVARANGQPITLDEVLSEVMNRFGTPLTFGLLNQEFMRMETIRRKTVITPEEFAEGVQLYLAQKKSMQAKTTLRQLLEASRMSWDTFERMVSDQVKIQKEVRADLNMPKRPEPLNPFVLQIWAGQKLRGQYSMEQDPARMPPGVLGEVHTTRSVGDLLADVASTPGQWTTSAVQGEKAPEIEVAPAEGGWPHYRVPDVPVEAMQADGSVGATPASAVFRALLEKKTGPTGGVPVESYLRIRVGDAPAVDLPVIQGKKQEKDDGPLAEVALAEIFEAVSKKGFTRQPDDTIREKEGSWPAYTVPEVWCVGSMPDQLRQALQQAVGSTAVVEKRVRVDRCFDLPDVPVAMFSRVDQEYVLGFSYGKLEAVHYTEALKSLARFRAAREALKARGIAVDEAKVQAIIDAENKKYNHPLFNRKMILQARGKTVFDEDRRIWISNGVDQIIGPDVDDKTLRQYYDQNILHFGQATVEAAHILAAVKDPKTGQVDYEASHRKIDQIAGELFAHSRPAMIFGDLARRFSDDGQTAPKGGSLGQPFTLRHQMARAFSEAAFHLRPGEVSAPVRTAHGWHLILCQKFNPPDPQKYSFDKPEIREQVKEEYQQERRDAWLEKNAYDALKIQKLSNLFEKDE